MKKGTEKQAGDRGKTPLKPQGVFKRIADARKRAGEKVINRSSADN